MPPSKPKTSRKSRLPIASFTTNAHLSHARMLDRFADMELQHGHVLAAERLAHRAAELRAVAR